MQREEAIKLVNEIFDLKENLNQGDPEIEEVETADEPRELPEGKRVVRTKSSGDRVYYLDEDKKTRQWITNPEVLEGLGFKIEDVVEVDDNTLLKYQMSSAIYRVE